MNSKFTTTLASIQGKYPRSRFKMPFNHKTSINAGRLYPLSCTEILPGDTVSLDTHILTRMATPIAPIMDNIKQDIWFFFVPRRLIDTNFAEVITYADWNGINDASIDTLYGPDLGDIPLDRHGLASYFNLPIGGYNKSILESLTASAFKAYVLIWNTYFRDENYQDEVVFDETTADPEFIDTPYLYNRVYDHNGIWKDVSLLPKDNMLHFNDLCLPLNEFHDVYTSVLPAPQKGPSVSVPLSGTAPVIGSDNMHSIGQYPFKFGSTYIDTDGLLSLYQNELYADIYENPVTSSGEPLNQTNLVADLSNASTSINQLRSAILTTHFLEQLARTGGDATRLQEYYLGFWGVVDPDARLQLPEFIASTRININVSEVVQTAGYDEASSTTLGTTGAVSRSASSAKSIFTKSFTEHGYLIALTGIRHDLTYAQGIPAHFEKKHAFDFYAPVFNGLGEQPVYKRRVLAPVKFNSDYMKGEFEFAGYGVSWDSILGYNEPWFEYRYRENKTSGMLNPVAKDGLDYWTLTKAFTGLDITGADVRLSDSETLQRALSVGGIVRDENGEIVDLGSDQFVIDYLEDMTITRIMPARSVPGINKL